MSVSAQRQIPLRPSQQIHTAGAFHFEDVYPNVDSGNPTSYEALRTAHGVYVEYVNGEREFYDLASDPFELYNSVASLTPVLRERLHRTLDALKSCHDALSCWAAAHIR